MSRPQTEGIQRERKQYRTYRTFKMVSRDTAERRQLCLVKRTEHESDEAVYTTNAYRLLKLFQTAPWFSEVQVQERQAKRVVSIRGDFQTQHI